jgi:amino acid adenylation domain-containing protein
MSMRLSAHLREIPSFVDLLRWRATHQPEQCAYTFLLDGEAAEERLTYAELDRRATMIGALLQSAGATGERVLLLYPPGLAYIVAFLGCLYAGAVAVPAYPPDLARLERSLPRLAAIVGDAQPHLALTTTPIRALAAALPANQGSFRNMRWLATDDLADSLAAAWRDPAAEPAMLALLQYTSGSTAAPKGVMLTHGNLLHNSDLIRTCFAHTPSSQGVIWLPPYHDMGLIGGILQPLYAGFPVTLLSPLDFLQRPLRWLQAITRYHATTSGGPNFAYDLCVRKIAPAQRSALDLSSWTVAFNGAEPIRADTLERFVEAFAPQGFRREAFYPCYGLAEATLIVAGGHVSQQPVVRRFQGAALRHGRAIGSDEPQTSSTLVACGQAVAGQQLVVVDAQALVSCPPGRVGEIWLAGPSVAQGYWRQPEETAQSFGARLIGGSAEPFLRTGDLGFVQDGELFIAGRLKDLIIIRGRNYYPQDIELTAERSHPALRPGCGAAFAVDVDGEERLALVQEVVRQARAADVAAVTSSIRLAVAEQHQVHAYAVVLIAQGSIPKTSSGKIQRYACREAFLAGSLDVVEHSLLEEPAVSGEPDPLRPTLLAAAPRARRALIESYLQEELARTLRIAAADVDRHSPTAMYGLDSLQAVDLQHSVEAQLGVELPMVSFLQGRSIAQLADEILARLTPEPAAEAPARAPDPPTSADHLLTPGQRALWFVHQLAPASAAYTIAQAVWVRGALDIGALRRAFQALVDRHPALRTTFAALHGEPSQQIQLHVEVSFQVADSANWGEAALHDRLIAEAQRPFDLQRGPLLRVCVFPRSAGVHALLLVVHHIIADLWSLTIMTRELSDRYTAERSGIAATLTPLRATYGDYRRWQSDMLAGPRGEQLWDYWRTQLAGAPAALELPTDRPRPPLQTYRGAAHIFHLNANLTHRLSALAHAAGATLYTTLLAVFQVLLFRYTGQADLLVGSPAAGRSRAEFANVVGYFVNPLVLRTDLSGQPTFGAALDRVRQTVLAALAHQDYPFVLLVERLQPERSPGNSPLFQVLFVLQNAHVLNDARLGDLHIEALPLDQQIAQFDLTLLIAEGQPELACTFQYNVDLFETTTILRMAGHLATLLEGIVATPGWRICDLPLLTNAERQQLLLTWNATQADYPQATCIQQLFEAQAARTPDAIAVVYETNDERRTTNPLNSSFSVQRSAFSVQLTYAELNRRANQLARHLRALEVGPEVPVGICMGRGPELVVGLLGILKAGGAYVPLDPAYPSERLAFMIADAQVRVLLTAADDGRWTKDDGGVRPVGVRLSSFVGKLVDLRADWPGIEQAHGLPRRGAVTPDSLAYVIYTSGSTGRPKGVAIAHRSAVALLSWARAVFAPAQLAGVLAATSIGFDLSVFELFVPLSWGGTVIVVENVLQLPMLPEGRQVTLINTVPSAMAELLRMGKLPAQVGTVNLAGEPLPQRLVEQIYQQGTVRQIFNLYGPSEDTTYSSFTLIPRDDAATPTIGRPIANTQIYLLDAQMQPVPIGVTGELFIGGVGLARGYLGRPALTAERFVPNPFAATNDARRTTHDETAALPGVRRPASGVRLYRTGDLARYRADGQIQFLGRRDYQVKLRGFRIELDEIAAVLRAHPAVRAAVAVVREDRPDDRRLVAYIVPQGDDRRMPNAESARASCVSELRTFLGARLPAYMVPTSLVVLDALPLTASGKVDQRALPVPDQSRPELEAGFVAPRTPVEQALADIWTEVLGVEQVGVYDNFFALGGHSLQATKVIARLREQLQVDLPVGRLFEAPTVADLAAHIEMLRWAAQGLQSLTEHDMQENEEGRL